MSREFFEKVYELSQNGAAFAIATVVKTEGSSSARAGAKAIVKADGSTLFGWVGGGCVESNVAKEALDSLNDGKPRLIHLDLNDELSGVGMPCGGAMDVYVEPHLSKPQLVIVGHGAIAEAVAKLGTLLNFRVVVDDSTATKEKYPTAESLITNDMDYTQFDLGPEAHVVIATQHKGDDKAARAALAKAARTIALIASKTRAGIVLDTLASQGVSKADLSRISSPAGLDLGAVEPEEIALAVMAEIVAARRGGSGRPLMEVKGATLSKISGNRADDPTPGKRDSSRVGAKSSREGPSCA
ncbi:MAG: XdhC family protein [bacterium]